MARQMDLWVVELYDILAGGEKFTSAELRLLTGWSQPRLDAVKRSLRDIMNDALVSTRGKGSKTWLTDNPAEAQQYGRQERAFCATHMRNVHAEVSKVLGPRNKLVRQLDFILTELED